MAKVKRSEIATYVNTTPTTTATYKLLGVGVTTAGEDMNPETTKETYIHEDNATTTVDSYAPTEAVEMTIDATDDVFTYVDGLYDDRAVLAAAETDIVQVYKYRTSTTGGWPANKQDVAIQIDKGPGGDGGKPAKISFTFLYQGDPTSGVFDVTSKTFTSNG